MTVGKKRAGASRAFIKRKSVQHQFRNKPCEYDGFFFPSKLEARYYLNLKLRVKAGEVIFFLRQVPFHLPGGVKYVLDFLEFHSDGSVHFIDTKGYETDKFKMKKKLVEGHYPIEIELVRKV